MGKAGNDNYVVFDRNDKALTDSCVIAKCCGCLLLESQVGGYCWITAANTHSKLQTEFGLRAECIEVFAGEL